MVPLMAMTADSGESPSKRMRDERLFSDLGAAGSTAGQLSSETIKSTGFWVFFFFFFQHRSSCLQFYPFSHKSLLRGTERILLRSVVLRRYRSEIRSDLDYTWVCLWDENRIRILPQPENTTLQTLKRCIDVYSKGVSGREWARRKYWTFTSCIS